MIVEIKKFMNNDGQTVEQYVPKMQHTKEDGSILEYEFATEISMIVGMLPVPIMLPNGMQLMGAMPQKENVTIPLPNATSIEEAFIQVEIELQKIKEQQEQAVQQSKIVTADSNDLRNIDSRLKIS